MPSKTTKKSKAGAGDKGGGAGKGKGGGAGKGRGGATARKEAPGKGRALTEKDAPAGDTDSGTGPTTERTVVEQGEPGDTLPAAPAGVTQRVPVAILEQTPSSERRARDLAGALGYQVQPLRTAEQILDALRASEPPELLLVALPEESRLIEEVRALPIVPPVIIASLAGPIATARERYRLVDADLFVVRPHSLESLCSVLHAATVVVAKNHLLRTQRGNEERLREQLARSGESGELFGFQNMAFFQRLLVMEIKRAKRFGYSLAACLVAPDPYRGDAPSQSAQRELMSRVAASITATIRDIDMPVDYADDRLLLFLPYTDLDGARGVGERVARVAAQNGRVMDAGREVRMSVSIGIAALTPGKPISFARLIRDASAALRAAQLKGGGRVVLRK